MIWAENECIASSCCSAKTAHIRAQLSTSAEQTTSVKSLLSYNIFIVFETVNVILGLFLVIFLIFRHVLSRLCTYARIFHNFLVFFSCFFGLLFYHNYCHGLSCKNPKIKMTCRFFCKKCHNMEIVVKF